MRKETWEMATLDWTLSGYSGKTINSAEVAELIFSEDQSQITDSYYSIEEKLCHRRFIYPCALTVLKTILPALPTCSLDARMACLDMIAEIALSKSAPEAGNLAEECIHEIRGAFWYFLYGLQFDDIRLAGSYIDVLGVIGTRCPDLKPTVIKYLKLAMSRDLQNNDLPMVKNTLATLES